MFGLHTKRSVAFAALSAALTFATAAAAEPKARANVAEDAKAQAAELVANATVAYRKGDFKQAIDLLLRAHKLDPQPVLLFNLARAYEGLGDIDAAIASLGDYLAADPKAPDRGAIEQRIGTLTRQRDERIALEKQRDAERRRADDERARAATSAPERRRSFVPYVLAGAGIAGLASGTVFGFLARSKHDSAASLATDQPTALDLQDKAKSYATISTVSFVAGGVLLAAGVSWWIVGSRSSASSPSPVVRLGIGPGVLFFDGRLP